MVLCEVPDPGPGSDPEVPGAGKLGEEGLDQGGLAGAIGAEDPELVPLLEVEVHGVQDPPSPPLHPHAFDHHDIPARLSRSLEEEAHVLGLHRSLHPVHSFQHLQPGLMFSEVGIPSELLLHDLQLTIALRPVLCECLLFPLGLHGLLSHE